MKFCRIFWVNFITGTASSLSWLSTASFPRDMSWERGWTGARASMKTRERGREERSLSSYPRGSFAVSKSSPAKLLFEWLNRNWLLLSVTYASANSTCAQPPLRLTPAHQHFFCFGWQIPGGGDSWAVESPGMGTKKEGKCAVLRQHCNLFSLIAQSDSAILSILMCDYLFQWTSSFVIALGF